MIHTLQAKPALLFLAVALSLPALAQAGEGGFIAGSSATLTARNYYFSRDYSDIVGPSQQSKAEEWAQGFILDFKSGYTPGPVGVGVDAIGLLGLKLDSSRDRVNTGLLPVTDEGRAADDYSRLGAALKVRLSKTELKIGEQQLMLPVLYFGDIRLLPPTYQGASLVSNEIAGLTLQGGQLRSTSLRNEAGDEELGAMLGFVPLRNGGGLITTDRFNYSGADYAFNANRTSVGAWYAQLEDLYNQRHFSLKHSEPVGDWVLGANLGYFDSAEDGEQLAGEIDNQAFYSLLSAKLGGHTVYLGYQAMFGDHGLPRVFANVSPLGNEVPTYAFDAADERSWQVRYDYDFAAAGIPGLSLMSRYVHGDNFKIGGANAKEWERNIDLGYVIQSGPLKNVGLRLRNVAYRGNHTTDIDENRFIVNYTVKFW